MTQFTLSQTTQTLINTAVSSGPGTNNINYKNAYNAIYNELVAHGSINAGTLYWFSQAGNVNTEATTPNAAGRFIWAYTEAAAASEGATVTDTDMQEASNAIARKVFQSLKTTNFLFDDANDGTNGFSPKAIIADDAGAGLDVIKNKYASANLDNAIWGGTLFARTLLQDSTYFSDYNIQHPPGSRDANAMFQGLFAGVSAVVQAGGSVTSQGITSIPNLDLDVLWSSMSTQTQSAVTLAFLAAGPQLTGLAALAAGGIYIWNALSGSRLTLSSNNSGALPVVYAYDPGTSASPAKISSATINAAANGSGSFTDKVGNQFASYTAGQLTGSAIKINGSKIETRDSNNLLQNSTQEITTGTNTSGVLDKTYTTTFTQIIVPSDWNSPNFTIATGINDNGVAVGAYGGISNFLYSNGTYTQVSVTSPGGAPMTQDINNSNTLAGYTDLDYGFKVANGVTTAVTDPSSSQSFVTGINNNGDIVGSSSAGAFIISGGTLTHVTIPYGSSAFFTDLNDSGVIVGNAVGPQSLYNFRTTIGGSGFVDDHGTFTQIIEPDAFSNSLVSKWNTTFVSGISNEGLVVGTYQHDQFGTEYYGFVDDDGVFTKIVYPGSISTYITGINNNNQIVGYAYMTGTQTVGFVADLNKIVTSNFYLENSGAVDLTASTELAEATVSLVAGNNAVMFGASKNIVNGALGATLYNFGAVFAQDVINNAFGGNTAANGEIDFTSSTITKQKLWLTQSGNDLVIVNGPATPP